MTRARIALALLLVLIVLGGAAFALRARRGGPMRATAGTHEGTTRAPAGVRIRVEVINTTRTHGLARRATRLLRDQGFDVVAVTSGGPTIDTTVVLDRSGHSAWAASIARLLGPAARTDLSPDSSRYLDITVLLGTAWRPPAQPLYP